MTTDAATIIPESTQPAYGVHVYTDDGQGRCSVCHRTGMRTTGDLGGSLLAHAPSDEQLAEPPHDYKLAISTLEGERTRLANNASMQRATVKRQLQQIEHATNTIRAMLEDSDKPIDPALAAAQVALILKTAPDIDKPLRALNDEVRRANMLRGAIEVLKR